jgi:hypothetical protein
LLVSEYCGRLFKSQQSNYEDCLLEVANNATGELLVSSFSFEKGNQLPHYIRNKYLSAKSNSLNQHWDKLLPLQKMKAEIFSCLIEGKKMIGKEINSLKVDTECLDPLVVQIAPQMIPHINTNISNFSVTSYE